MGWIIKNNTCLSSFGYIPKLDKYNKNEYRRVNCGTYYYVYCRWTYWCVSWNDYGKDFPLGIVGNVIAGLIGSWVGSALFGHWGPEWGGIFVLPALLGAIVFILIVTFFSRMLRKA